MTENEIGKVMVDAAIAVNKTLGERKKEGSLAPRTKNAEDFPRTKGTEDKEPLRARREQNLGRDLQFAPFYEK